MRRRRKNTVHTSGLGILDMTQIILVLLKLVGVIKWDWLVVLIPLWIGLFALGLIAIAMIIEYHKSKL